MRENDKSYILNTLAIANDDPREDLVAILPVLHPRLLVHVPAVHLVMMGAKCDVYFNHWKIEIMDWWTITIESELRIISPGDSRHQSRGRGVSPQGSGQLFAWNATLAFNFSSTPMTIIIDPNDNSAWISKWHIVSTRTLGWINQICIEYRGKFPYRALHLWH